MTPRFNRCEIVKWDKLALVEAQVEDPLPTEAIHREEDMFGVVLATRERFKPSMSLLIQHLTDLDRIVPTESAGEIIQECLLQWIRAGHEVGPFEWVPSSKLVRPGRLFAPSSYVRLQIQEYNRGVRAPDRLPLF